MSTCIYWFRSDLRLHDHAPMAQALAKATLLLPVYCHAPDDTAPGPWGFARTGPHRQRFIADTLADLRAALHRRGSGLLEVRGRPAEALLAVARSVGADDVYCEDIAQADAAADVAALRGAGLAVHDIWHSSLLDPQRLPYRIADLPRFYTPFRQSVEKLGVAPREPLAAPDRLPPLPPLRAAALEGIALVGKPDEALANPPADGDGADDARSAFPYRSAGYRGGESAGLAHLARYFSGALPPAYKSTRNRLSGIATSTKFSPWLATGALSARTVLQALRAYEARHGASDGSYAIWFELLWRDFFRFLALRARALAPVRPAPPAAAASAPPGADAALLRWREGRTGVALVDAGMRELAATGFVSNRLRQVVASFLIHELRGDPRAGAAWFAAQLVDFDPYSNDGNWQYIAGTGADPRGGRHFNIEKQTRDHDPDGQYRVLWGVE